ncbi:MAG: hypothetical protein ACFFEY_00220 [Candidatus Thorarchaeota archaeon]
MDSIESFDCISKLLFDSLGDYRKRFFSKNCKVKEEYSLKDLNNDEFNKLQYVSTNSEDEYLAISNDIHSILSNCSEFSTNQKIEFCNNQRYFMKLYLRELLIKLNRSCSC